MSEEVEAQGRQGQSRARLRDGVAPHQFQGAKEPRAQGRRQGKEAAHPPVGQRPAVFPDINQMALLHLHIHPRFDLDRAFAAAVKMDDLRHRRKDAAPARLADAATPVRLFGVDEEGVVQRPHRLQHTARHQHEHARDDIDIPLGPAVPVTIPGPPETGSQPESRVQAQFHDQQIEGAGIGKTSSLNHARPLQHLTADAAHIRVASSQPSIGRSHRRARSYQG